MTVNRRKKTTTIKPVKHWYLFRKKGCKYFGAYQLTGSEYASIHDNTEVLGPVTSPLHALIAVNKYVYHFFRKESSMHLAEILVKVRAALSKAEYDYSNGKKGDCAFALSGLGLLLHKELPGGDSFVAYTEPEPVQQESVDPENRVN